MKENIKEVYSDGIGKIHFLGGTIRLDLFSFIPSESDGEEPTPEITERIIMSPNAFLASYESFVNMLKKLEDAGIVSRKAPEAAEDAVKVESVATDSSDADSAPAPATPETTEEKK